MTDDDRSFTPMALEEPRVSPWHIVIATAFWAMFVAVALEVLL